MLKRHLPLALLLVLFGGCTVHPAGEAAERQLAESAGASFKEEFEKRSVPALPDKPALQDLIDYALLTNAELESKYWEWRAAIEQVPQAGTEPSNVAIFGGTALDKGKFSIDRTTVTIGNDPMADIVLPGKLSTAAEKALANAKAAGKRFDEQKFTVRAKVIEAYYSYLLNQTLIRLEKENFSLLDSAASVTEVKSKVGSAAQEDYLKIKNESAMSGNELASLESKQGAIRAQLNSLLGRPDQELILGDEFPAPLPLEQLQCSDADVLRLAAERNPSLLALANQLEADKQGLSLAKLQYLPDLSISVGADLGGMAQNLLGMLTLPVFRYEAIQGGIHQAEAMLRSTAAMKRQTENDLAARVVLDLATVRDLDRQLLLFNDELIPRAESIVSLSRKSYEVGRATLLEFLDNQRAFIALKRLAANIRAMRENSLADLEAAAARSLTLGPENTQSTSNESPAETTKSKQGNEYSP